MLDIEHKNAIGTFQNFQQIESALSQLKATGSGRIGDEDQSRDGTATTSKRSIKTQSRLSQI